MTPSLPDEAALVAASRAGDRDAFGRLVEMHEPRLMSYLIRMTRSRERAEDLFQETFLRLWRARETLRPGNPFAFLLLRSARNLAVSAARSRGAEGRMLTAVARAGTAAGAPGDGNEEGAEARAAIDRLPPEQKEAVALKVWGGLRWDEIGQLLGFSADTAARRFQEGISALARDLGPRLGMEGRP